MNKAEKLQVAAYTAQTIRRDPEVLRAQRIKVVGPDGTVVREIDGLTLHKTLRERVGIEFDVQEGQKPTHKTCPCGRIWKVPAHTAGARSHAACPHCRAQTVCPGFEGPCPEQAKPIRGAFTPGAIRGRHGQLWRCHGCSMRATQEVRTERMRETRSTPESRRAFSERVKAWHASLTPEQKEELAQKSKEAKAASDAASRAASGPAYCAQGHELTPENTELTSKGRACRTCREQARVTAPMRRAESMRETLADVPAETRAERSRRAWDTRRARYSPEELVEQSKRSSEKRLASMPAPEVLAERAKRAWDTRRARYGSSGK